MPDQHKGRAEGLTSPADNARAINIADFDADLGYVTRGVWVGVAGDLVVIMNDGQEAVFTGIQNGTLLPIRVSQILTADTQISPTVLTSAAGIIGLF